MGSTNDTDIVTNLIAGHGPKIAISAKPSSYRKTASTGHGKRKHRSTVTAVYLRTCIAKREHCRPTNTNKRPIEPQTKGVHHGGAEYICIADCERLRKVVITRWAGRTRDIRRVEQVVRS